MPIIAADIWILSRVGRSENVGRLRSGHAASDTAGSRPDGRQHSELEHVTIGMIMKANTSIIRFLRHPKSTSLLRS